MSLDSKGSLIQREALFVVSADPLLRNKEIPMTHMSILET